MKSLRLFINRNARFSKGPNYLSNELRLLDWPEYPSESLPLNFRGEKLVVFKMQNSLFKELKEGFKNLTVMNFSKCKYLEKIPDLSNNKNLVKLTLDLCTNLVEVHHSVGFLDNLDTLSVNRCSNLWSFPKRLKLRSLKSINLEGCSSLENFPEIECEMKGLHRLDLKGTSIKELPSSIAYLTRLEIFNLPGCRNLPASILQLQHLKFIHLDDSSGLKFLKQVGDSTESIQSIIKFQSLQEASLQDGILSESNFFTTFNFSSTLENLHLSGSDIVSLPACMKGFVRLRYLWLNDCKKLEEILDLPPNILEVYAAGCMSLERFLEVSKKCELNASDSKPLHWIDLSRCNKMLVNIGNHVPNSLWEQGHLKHHRFGIIFVGHKIPDWFDYHKVIAHDTLSDIGCSDENVEDGQFTTGFVGSGVPDWAIHHKEEIHIHIHEPLCLYESRRLAFCAVIGPIHSSSTQKVNDSFSIGVEINGVRLERFITDKTFDSVGSDNDMCSEHVWVDFFVGESLKIGGDNLQVILFCTSKSIFFKAFGIHIIQKHEGRVKNHQGVRHEDCCLGGIFNFCFPFPSFLTNQTVDGGEACA